MIKYRLCNLMVLTACLVFVGSVAAWQGGGSMSVTLTGKAEVPGPGDDDGTGTAILTMNQEKGEVCYEITVSGVDAPGAAHIHEGAADKAGPPVVDFKPQFKDNAAKNCVAADKELLKKISETPANYYVNVHNAAFPKGAVRGQLTK
jgi:hypothetical protein